MNLIHFPTQTRINDVFLVGNKRNDIYKKHSDYFLDSTYTHDLASPNWVLNQNNEHFDDFSFIKQSFVFLVTETIGEYPYPCLTEKTWRTMLNRMPFMIVGGKHSLKLLKSFGFKTFNDYWNEDYDNFENLIDRIEMVTDNLDKLSKLTQNDLDKFNEKMLPIVEHNINHLEYFYNQQTIDIEEKLQNL